MAKQWVPRVARLIAENRYDDAIREADTGIHELGEEMALLKEQQNMLAQLRDAATMIAKHMLPSVRPSTPKSDVGPKLSGDEIGTVADSLFVNGKVEVTADEVREELGRRGIDTSVVRHPNAVISTVLSRDKRFRRVGIGVFRRAAQPQKLIGDGS